eukprot:COSAG06_NODE_2201_length_7352_cov_18.385771_7_plen_121_part_00
MLGHATEHLRSGSAGATQSESEHQPLGHAPSGSAAAAVSAALRATPGAYERSGQSRARGSFSEYSVSTRDNTPVPEPNAFGVTSFLPRLGILPRKVRTAEEAVARLASQLLSTRLRNRTK